jgi:multisubunit Na+/H+ antiporter MnhG subunit
MHRSHITSCALLLVVAALIAIAWGVPAGTLAVLAILLLCPLAMLLMMRFMMTAGHPEASGSDPDRPTW